jgi:hypothetical protein
MHVGIDLRILQNQVNSSGHFHLIPLVDFILELLSTPPTHPKSASTY